MSGGIGLCCLLSKPFFPLRRKQMADQVMYSDPWSDLRREYTVDHADIRREQAVGFGETRYAIATGNDAVNREVLVTGANVSTKVDEAADKIQQRAADFFIAGQARDFDNSRDLAALRAATDLANQKLSTEILLSTEKAATATALESARLGTAVALGQANLSKEIAQSKYDLAKEIANEGDATRALIQSLKNDELNRLLIERNTDINHFRNGYWDAVGSANNAQFASVASQLNAFQSQLQETRQGMVNFGTMAGVGQSSANNAVR
jgi:hypothetical protein